MRSCAFGCMVYYMLCSCWFSINIQKIIIVLILGLPPSFLQLWQETGRARRYGRSSISVCFAYPRSIALPCDSCRKSGKRKCECASRTYSKELVNTNNCKRCHILHTFPYQKKTKSSVRML